MAQHDDLERYERTEAQEIVRLLQAMQPQQEAQAPADFRVKVLHRVEERRSRHGVLAWLTDLMTPAWAPAAVALGLVVSLGCNIWLGTQMWKPHNLGNQQTARTNQGLTDKEYLFNAYAFQTGIQSETPLETLVTEHSTLEKTTIAFGFTGKPTKTAAFLTGTLYAEALAYLRGDNQEAVLWHLAALEDELTELQAPAALSKYVNTLYSFVEQHQDASTAAEEWLALFEPLYEEYARSHGAERLIFFRAGAWLENMNLAAAAGDKTSLQQDATVQYFIQAMPQLTVSQEAIAVLEQIRQALDKPALDDRDMTTVLKLVKKVQRMLG
jgi:hypothetical protein